MRITSYGLSFNIYRSFCQRSIFLSFVDNSLPISRQLCELVFFQALYCLLPTTVECCYNALSCNLKANRATLQRYCSIFSNTVFMF